MESSFLQGVHAIFLIVFTCYFGSQILTYRGADALACVSLTVIPFVVFLVTPGYDGLEYEDAYIHQAAAKYQVFNNSSTNGFYTDVCAAGSLRNCTVHVTYGTHLIGFSTLLSSVYRVFGDMPFAANTVSCAASILTLLVVWWFASRHLARASQFAIVALILSAPSFYIIGGSAFAEPLFALYLVCFLLLTAHTQLAAQARVSVAEWLLLASSGVLLISTKKEGILAVIVVALWSFSNGVYRWRFHRITTSQRILFLVLCFVLTLFAVVGLDLGAAATRHSHDIHASAFDLRFVTRLAPIIVQEMSRVADFGWIWVVMFLLVSASFVLRDKLTLLPLALVIAYFVLYSVHARHAAFVHGVPVDPQEMVRYLYPCLLYTSPSPRD